MSTIFAKTLSKDARKKQESIGMNPEIKRKLIEIKENDEAYNLYSFSQMVNKACEVFIKDYESKRSN